MSTPESRAREAYDEAQRSKISGPSLVKPDGMARESQGEVDQLRTELARLQSRLEECENERDELAKKRKDDSFECSVMSAITGRENGETLTMAVDRTCRELDKANQDLTALLLLVAQKDEALGHADFSNISSMQIAIEAALAQSLAA